MLNAPCEVCRSETGTTIMRVDGYLFADSKGWVEVALKVSRVLNSLFIVNSGLMALTVAILINLRNELPSLIPVAVSTLAAFIALVCIVISQTMSTAIQEAIEKYYVAEIYLETPYYVADRQRLDQEAKYHVTNLNLCLLFTVIGSFSFILTLFMTMEDLDSKIRNAEKTEQTDKHTQIEFYWNADLEAQPTFPTNDPDGTEAPPK